MSPTAHRIDPRVKRTRQLLEQSFIALLTEKGFQAITVRDITKRATLNRATFYKHFEDKYALLDHVIRTSFQDSLREVMAPEALFSLANMRQLIVATCDYMQMFNSPACNGSNAQFDPLIEKEVQRQIYAVVLRWIEGADNQIASPEVTAAALSWMIFGVCLRWGNVPAEQQSLPLPDQLITLIRDGFGHALPIDQAQPAALAH